MQADVSSNLTVAGTDLLPCFGKYSSSRKTKGPSAACVLLYGFLSLLCLVTVCGNLLVIISVLYFKQLHTPTNSLVLSLAVADLLVGVLVFPLSMTFSFASCLYDAGLFCRIRNSFDTLLSLCSVMHLYCISVDRYYAVCRPLTYKSKISHRVVVVMITVSWSASVAFSVGITIPRITTAKCGKACAFDDVLVNTFASLFSFYLPVVIMLSIYGRIFLVAQRQARRIHNRTKCAAAVSKMESKATKTLAIVLGGFLFCWAPFFLYITVLPFTTVSAPVPVTEALAWLALSNSTLNPFIYAFFYSWFRSAFKIIVSGKIIRGNLANSKLF